MMALITLAICLQLEAELSSLQDFLDTRDVEEPFPGFADTDINYKPSRTDKQTAGDAATTLKPKTLDELLSYLENAPEGPVELDPNILYSPRSSITGSISESEPSLSRFYREQPSSSFHSFTTNEEPTFHAGIATDAGQQFSNRAYLSKQRALQRLDALRREKQVAEMAECTFAPTTGRPPVGPKAHSHLKVEDRLLLTTGQRKEEVARRLQEEREEAQRASCTFAPHLVAPPERHIKEPRRPIYERLNEEWKRKVAVLAEATAKEHLLNLV